MRFRLAPRLMTSDDLETYKRNLGNLKWPYLGETRCDRLRVWFSSGHRGQRFVCRHFWLDRIQDGRRLPSK